MNKNIDNQGKPKSKSFLWKFFDKLDKKMEEKAKSQSCCCVPKEKQNKSCNNIA